MCEKIYMILCYFNDKSGGALHRRESQHVIFRNRSTYFFFCLGEHTPRYSRSKYPMSKLNWFKILWSFRLQISIRIWIFFCCFTFFLWWQKKIGIKTFFDCIFFFVLFKCCTQVNCWYFKRVVLNDKILHCIEVLTWKIFSFIGFVCQTVFSWLK